MQQLLKEQFGRIIRYSYPGFLALFLFAFTDPQHFKNLLATVGVVLISAFALVVGAAVYVGYRLVIGELFLFPLVNILHTALSRAGIFPSGVTAWLAKEFGVQYGRRRAAYGYLRFRSHSESEVRYVDYVHTELHILYISSIMIISESFYCQLHHLANCLSGFICGGVILLAAIVADIHAHVRERLFFENVITRSRIRQLLKEGGFVNETLVRGHS